MSEVNGVHVRFEVVVLALEQRRLALGELGFGAPIEYGPTRKRGATEKDEHCANDYQNRSSVPTGQSTQTDKAPADRSERPCAP